MRGKAKRNTWDSCQSNPVVGIHMELYISPKQIWNFEISNSGKKVILYRDNVSITTTYKRFIENWHVVEEDTE